MSFRRINEFKRGYQFTNNLVKDENGDLLADSNSFLSRWENCFSQLLNVYNFSDIWYIDVHSAEPFVLSRSRLEVEIAFAKLKIL
jgi:hypothetical protein